MFQSNTKIVSMKTNLIHPVREASNVAEVHTFIEIRIKRKEFGTRNTVVHDLHTRIRVQLAESSRGGIRYAQHDAMVPFPHTGKLKCARKIRVLRYNSASTPSKEPCSLIPGGLYTRRSQVLLGWNTRPYAPKQLPDSDSHRPPLQTQPYPE